MIFGIGTDIAKISRFENNAQAIALKHLTQNEQAEIAAKNEDLSKAVAKRFAAKEACAKAIGTGFSDGLYLKHIEILHEKSGKPYIKLYGKAEEYMAKTVGDYRVFLSVSDDGEYAQAFVVIEKI